MGYLSEPSTLIEGRRRLRRLNINLLYALDALLHEPSLTAAAHSIAISQPAMSMKLRQLRELFGDELVVFGERRQLTALGARWMTRSISRWRSILRLRVRR